MSVSPRGLSTSADMLTLSGRTGNQGAAEHKTRAALNLKNQYQKVATLSMAGNLRLRAGHNVTLAEFGALNGIWLTGSVRHNINRSAGYSIETEVVRGPVAKKSASGAKKMLTVYQADGGTSQTVAPKKVLR
ncbi:hypothetical protein HY28_005285 [Salmonella enterica subsp. enterica]|nr:hypothetical protein [Salmonella enterica subsp. enterica serovar Panama]